MKVHLHFPPVLMKYLVDSSPTCLDLLFFADVVGNMRLNQGTNQVIILALIY